jgi:hypothetical protein
LTEDQGNNTYKILKNDGSYNGTGSWKLFVTDPIEADKADLFQFKKHWRNKNADGDCVFIVGDSGITTRLGESPQINLTKRTDSDKSTFEAQYTTAISMLQSIQSDSPSQDAKDLALIMERTLKVLKRIIR